MRNVMDSMALKVSTFKYCPFAAMLAFFAGHMCGVCIADQTVFACQAREALPAHPTDQGQPDFARNIDAPCGKAGTAGQERGCPYGRI